MKITGVKPMALFAFTMDDGTNWFRMFHPNPKKDSDNIFIWLECRGNDAFEVPAEKVEELEKAFNEWAEGEQLKAIEELRKRGYNVVAVGSLDELNDVMASMADDTKTVH